MNPLAQAGTRLSVFQLKLPKESRPYQIDERPYQILVGARAPGDPLVNHRQYQSRGIFAGMVDRLLCHLDPVAHAERLSGVQVSRESGEIAGRNLNTQSVTCRYRKAGRPQINIQPVHRTGIDR